MQDFTDDFPTWWTSDTAIATANKNSIHGVAAGTTNHYAESDPMYWGVEKAFQTCPISRPQTTAGTNVAPTIKGPNTVWWFNGQNPDASDYPTSVTLTSSGGSSTQWSVSQTDSKVKLSSTSGATVTVSATGSKFSASVGDISFTVTASGIKSSPFTMTARTPWKLVPVSTNTACYASPQTYGTSVSYNVEDNLSTVMSSDIYWNESLGTSTCQGGSNWCNYQIISGGADSNPLSDVLDPPDLNVAPAPSPTPTCSGQGSGTTLYRTIPQTIMVGSSDAGKGVQAQTDTLGYYKDHAQHNGIQSPVQPPQ